MNITTTILCDRRAGAQDDAGSRRWKELVRVGNFIHPKTKQKIDVTPSRLKHWADSANEMISTGVRIPINVDHNLSALASLGRMLAFEVRGDGLWGEQEPADQQCADVIRRNDVSIGFEPNYTDGNGRTWSDAIYHVSATQFPVITNLQQAVAASHFPAGVYLSAGEYELPSTTTATESLINNAPTLAAMKMMRE